MASTVVRAAAAVRRRLRARSSRSRSAFSEASLATWMDTDACAENTSRTCSSWSVNVRRSKRLRTITPVIVPL
jgi:hypothetical protein